MTSFFLKLPFTFRYRKYPIIATAKMINPPIAVLHKATVSGFIAALIRFINISQPIASQKITSRTNTKTTSGEIFVSQRR